MKNDIILSKECRKVHELLCAAVLSRYRAMGKKRKTQLSKERNNDIKRKI